MGMLAQRLNNVNETSVSPASAGTKMYTVEGAQFQERALNALDFKGSVAHKMIGSLVTAINNNQISVRDAEIKFASALVKA
jgi:hypothetical protein